MVESRVMSTQQLEKRIKAIEDELARLKAELGRNGSKSAKAGWRATFGSFAGDPIYVEAMKLGRKYRESTRPKSRSKRR